MLLIRAGGETLSAMLKLTVWGITTFHLLDAQEIPIFVSEGSDETKLEAAGLWR